MKYIYIYIYEEERIERIIIELIDVKNISIIPNYRVILGLQYEKINKET